MAELYKGPRLPRKVLIAVDNSSDAAFIADWAINHFIAPHDKVGIVHALSAYTSFLRRLPGCLDQVVLGYTNVCIGKARRDLATRSVRNSYNVTWQMI